mgnify:CR=1 FL=1
MENLGIDGKLLLAQMINFLLFFILVKQFVVKPFTTFLNQERKSEEEKSKLLEKLRKSEETGLEAEKKMKEKMKKEFDVLFVTAKKEAQNLRAEMIKQAEADAQDIKSKNKKMLEEEKRPLAQVVKEENIDPKTIKDLTSDRPGILGRLKKSLDKVASRVLIDRTLAILAQSKEGTGKIVKWAVDNRERIDREKNTAIGTAVKINRDCFAELNVK